MRARLAVVLMGLGCGGLFTTAVNQQGVEAFYKMEAQLDAMPEGYPRDRVKSVVQRGAVDAAEGEIGFAALVNIQVAFDEVVADGKVEESEASVFEATYDRVLAEQ